MFVVYHWARVRQGCSTGGIGDTGGIGTGGTGIIVGIGGTGMGVREC